MAIAVLTGALAGVGMGYALQRGQLCFNSMFTDAWSGRFLLLRGWALAVALGAVGLAVVFLTPLGEGLNTGLAFRPVANIIGVLLIGWGMAIAQSCVSGLLYKFGAGMAGASVGILGWIGGESAAGQVRLPGPQCFPAVTARRSRDSRAATVAGGRRSSCRGGRRPLAVGRWLSRSGRPAAMAVER